MAKQLDLNHGFYYSFLNNAQKKTYDTLLTHMRQFETEFAIDPVSTADYLIANRAVLDDHPELWWADTPARYSFNLVGKVTKHQFLQLTGKEKQITAAMANAIQDILAQARQLDSDWKKALLFHDFIVSKTKFNTGRDSDGYLDQNISSVFMGGNSVCAGYARAFMLLCRSVGIECIYVSGPATKRGNTIRHAWNMAYIDGNWAWIDCTWDDLILENGVESCEHDYFCLNDTWISKEHPIPSVLETGNDQARLSISFPKASSLKMEFHRLAGTYFEKYDANQVLASVQQQAPGGKVRLRFGSAQALAQAIQGVVIDHNLVNQSQLRITKDDIMCVLRIDRR